MSLLATILIVLIAISVFGGGFINDGAYRGPGFGLGGILIIILVVLLATGRI